jgi:hypothetical protein
LLLLLWFAQKVTRGGECNGGKWSSAHQRTLHLKTTAELLRPYFANKRDEYVARVDDFSCPSTSFRQIHERQLHLHGTGRA